MGFGIRKINRMENTTTPYSYDNPPVGEYTNERGITYVENGGFWFHKGTSVEVQDAILAARKSGGRVRVWLGEVLDAEPVLPWLEEHCVTGRIGKSTGWVPIPLLIHDRRAMGGPGLLDNCIIRMVDTETKRELYRHPNYTEHVFEIKHEPLPRDESRPYQPEINYRVYTDGGESYVAGFRTEDQAERWVAFMKGERMSK